MVPNQPGGLSMLCSQPQSEHLSLECCTSENRYCDARRQGLSGDSLVHFCILVPDGQVSVQVPCQTIHTTMAEDGSPHQLLQQLSHPLPHQQNHVQNLQQALTVMQLQSNLSRCKRVLRLKPVYSNHSVKAASTVTMRMEHLGLNGSNGPSHLMLASTGSVGIKRTGEPWCALGRQQVTNNMKASCSQIFS